MGTQGAGYEDKVKVGCCGFPVSMKKYFEVFNVVELQKTFYKLPKRETAARWREEAPESFEFVVKASQLITHPPSSPTYRKAGLKIDESKKKNYGFFKPTDEVFKAYEETVEIVRILKGKLVLFQTPARFSENDENIKNLFSFFESIERKDLILMWEPRGNWNEETLMDIFKKLNLVHVVDPFKNKSLYGSIAYYRLHGLGEGYRYRFSDDELLYLKSLLKEGIETYVMFNNTNMFEDASRFRELLKD